MANRIPLIVDTDDGNKLKELPVGDNLNLTGSGIVGAGNVQATSLTVAGVPYDPFSGAYADLTGKPTIPSNTDDIVEGTKKYHTDERVDDRVKDLLQAGTGIQLVYNDTANTLTITATGIGSGGGGGGATALDGLTDVVLTAPTNGQVLKYNGNAFVNTSVAYSEITGTPNLDDVATSGSYNDLSNKPIIPTDINDMSDVDTATTAPTNGQVLKWLNNKWIPADDITSGGGGLNADTLDGFDGSYYLDWNNVTSKPVYQTTDLDDISISNIAGDQILKWSGLSWVNATNEPTWANIQSKPTTISGFGITDSPTVLTDLNIADGSANTFLKANGNGTFTFTNSLSGVGLVNVSGLDFAGSTITLTSVLDEDDMSSNSATALATQQSIKAYVDSEVSGFSVGLASRSTTAGTTNSIADDVSEGITLTGFKSYALLNVTVSAQAWVRIYTSSAARTADASRGEGVDPAPDAGVVAEVLTSSTNQTVEFGPSIIGSNTANDTTIYINVKNKSGTTQAITTTLTLLKLEA